MTDVEFQGNIASHRFILSNSDLKEMGDGISQFGENSKTTQTLN
jgi:hypothetical protein